MKKESSFFLSRGNSKGFTFSEAMIGICILGILIAGVIHELQETLAEQASTKYHGKDDGLRIGLDPADGSVQTVTIFYENEPSYGKLLRERKELPVRYFKDTHTGICFASFRGQFFYVPCDKVSAFAEPLK